MSKTGIRFPFSFSVCFWLCWVFVALLEPSLIAASHSWLQCSGLSSCGARAVGLWVLAVAALGLRGCGPRAQLVPSMQNLPRPGIEPMSSALAGGFLSPAPPGKLHPSVLNNFGLPKARWCYWKRTCPPVQET